MTKVSERQNKFQNDSQSLDATGRRVPPP